MLGRNSESVYLNDMETLNSEIWRVTIPKKSKEEIRIRSSAAEYLTYVASAGDREYSFEMRYEDENVWLTQKMMARTIVPTIILWR